MYKCEHVWIELREGGALCAVCDSSEDRNGKVTIR
jgi:hypothetical protein